MKCDEIKDNVYSLSLTEKEVDGIAKSTFFIQELEKYKSKSVLFKSLVDFLLEIRKGFLQITN